ncbi:MAG: hypothetical protein WA231_12510 [Methylocella sp.]
MEDAGQSKDSAFERQKWDDEVRLRNREFEIRDREAQAAIRAQETNPLVLALLSATLAGVGNLAVAWKTGADQLALAKDKNTEEKAIEETKAESARILVVVKASDPDRAAQNLTFLLDSWLITTQDRRDKLAAYLAKRKGGQGVSIQEASAGLTSQAPSESKEGKPPKEVVPEFRTSG